MLSNTSLEESMSISNTFLGHPYPREVLELVHDSTLEQNHRIFEANHAIILEEQKIIRK
jgi:hypothetical protein